MPILDIFGVSESLRGLIHNGVHDLVERHNLMMDWTDDDPSVLLLPPDKMEGKGKYGICLYLYHISEDPHFKNLPAPHDASLPLRYTPMGLNLYYQLTAHSDADGHPDASAKNEQLLMGLAVKVLRDYPTIDRLTEVNGEKVLGAELAEDGDRLRICLQPIPHNEAVSFWSAGSFPLRLATYYQVSVVMLEPETSRSRTGRVLSYGAYGFVSGAPRLTTSENVLEFSPDPTGTRPPHRVVLQPAQVPFGSTVTFRGDGLTGDRTLLALRSARWREEDDVEDAAWNVRAASGRVEATVLPRVSLSTGAATVVPGVYSARVKVKTRRTTSDGSIREFAHTSNATPFMVTVRLDGDADVLVPGPDGSVALTGYCFDHPDLPEDPLEVIVGDVHLERSSGGSLAPGEYEIESTPSEELTAGGDPIPEDPQTLRFMMPDVPPTEWRPGTLVPLRIVVNGAESSPKWIQVPGA